MTPTRKREVLEAIRDELDRLAEVVAAKTFAEQRCHEYGQFCFLILGSPDKEIGITPDESNWFCRCLWRWYYDGGDMNLGRWPYVAGLTRKNGVLRWVYEPRRMAIDLMLILLEAGELEKTTIHERRVAHLLRELFYCHSRTYRGEPITGRDFPLFQVNYAWPKSVCRWWRVQLVNVLRAYAEDGYDKWTPLDKRDAVEANESRMIALCLLLAMLDEGDL